MKKALILGVLLLCLPGLLSASTIFTDADKTKLDGIQEGATNDDQPDSDAEVPDDITIGAGGSVNDAAIPAGVTRDSEWDTIGEIETATGVDIITSSENSDSDDDVTDDNIESMTTSGGSGTAPMSDGAGGLTMSDVWTEAENTAAAYISGNEMITLSGDASGSGATAITVTVSDDSHSHVIGNIDTFTKSALEGQISDASDLAEADGDTYTGTHDFGGAALEIPSGTNPTTGADGRIAHDTDDDAIEIDGKLITTKHQRDKDIWDPDTIQASKDAIPFFPVEAEAFPHGITVTDCGIKIDTAASYSVTFEEWTDPTTHSSDIETVATSSATEAEDDGTMADGSVAAGSIIFIDLPDTDVTWLNVWIVYTVDEGD